MTMHQLQLDADIPDLRDMPLDRLAKMDDSVFANSIAEYLARLKANDVPVYAFNSSIARCSQS